MRRRPAAHPKIPGGNQPMNLSAAFLLCRRLKCTSGTSGNSLLALVAAIALMMPAAVPASAYWDSTGSASAQASTSILNPPTNVTVPSEAAGTVAVSWTASTGELAPEGYFVTRSVNADGSSAVPACTTGPAELTTALSCADPVASGAYYYTVTAVYRSWASSSPSNGPVTISDVARFVQAAPPSLSFDSGPAATTLDTTPTITGTSDAPRGSAVTVIVADQVLQTEVTTDGTWSVTAEVLTAGTHPVEATVQDTSGQGAIAQLSLIIEVSPPPLQLGSAGSYSVLAGTGVVNTGPTSLSGDLGVYPSTAVSGFGPGALAGSVHAGDLYAAQAQADLQAAIGDGSSRVPHTEISGDPSGRTLHTGVHHSASTLAIIGTVTLDAQGDPDAVFLFQTDAAFNTAESSNVILVNGAQASNVFWVAADAVEIGAGSFLSGTVLARGPITLGASTVLSGRALSMDTVTLMANTLTGAVPQPAETAAPPNEPVPAAEPSTKPAPGPTPSAEPTPAVASTNAPRPEVDP